MSFSINHFLITWRTFDLKIWSYVISSLDSKWQVLKIGMPVFQLFYEMNLKKSLHFKASEDIMTKFKSQALHITRIRLYCNSGGCGNPPSLWNIGILLHKQATWYQQNLLMISASASKTRLNKKKVKALFFFLII